MNISNGFCPNCPLIPRIFIDNDKVHLTCRCDYYGTFELKDYWEKIKNINTPTDIGIIDIIIDIKNNLDEVSSSLNKLSILKQGRELPWNRREREKQYAAYAKCIEKNNTIIKMLRLFIRNYNGSEEMKNNIINNSHFTTYIQLPYSTDDMISFYDNYSIILPINQRIPNIKEIISFSPPKNINTVLLLRDNTIAVGGYDDCISIYNPSEKNPIEKRKTQLKEITSMCQIDDGRIVSCYQKDILIGDKLNQIAHEGTILVVISLPGNRIASGSRDKTVRIWNPDSTIPITILKGHSKEVHSLLYMKERNILISSEEYKIFMWSMATYEQIDSISGLKGISENTLHQLDKDRVIYAYIATLVIFNLENKIIEKTFEPFKTQYIDSLLVVNKIVYGGTLGGMLFQLNVLTGKIQCYVIDDQKRITSIVNIDEETLVIVSARPSMKICSIKNNKITFNKNYILNHCSFWNNSLINYKSMYKSV